MGHIFMQTALRHWNLSDPFSVQLYSIMIYATILQQLHFKTLIYQDTNLVQRWNITKL